MSKRRYARSILPILSVALVVVSTPSYARRGVNTGYARGASVVCSKTGCSERPAGPSGVRNPAMIALRRACGSDAWKFCSGVIQNGPARAACMREHGPQLSASCQQARRILGI